MKNKELSKEEESALWKFGIIAPMANGLLKGSTCAEYCRQITQDPMVNPATGKSKLYSPNTIKFWLFQYQHGGLPALLPKARRDRGTSRKLDEAAQNEISFLITEFPRMPNTIVRKKLLECGAIDDSLSQSTVDRFIKALRREWKEEYVSPVHDGKERKAFEFEHRCDCWQADTTFLKRIDGRQVALMIIEDDATRLVVGYGMFYEDNAVNFLQVFKKAVQVYGRPSVLYMDNGAPYRNKYLDWTCAQLGIAITHTPPYDGPSKGKVERINGIAKNQWLHCVKWDDFKTIEDVEASFATYLFSDYQHHKHSALKDENGNLMSPHERFMSDPKKLKKVPAQKLEEAFLRHETRKVKTDSTFSVFKEMYEAPCQYIGQTVDVYIDPLDHDRVWISEGTGHPRTQVRKVNKLENAHTKRKQHISFRENSGNEE